MYFEQNTRKRKIRKTTRTEYKFNFTHIRITENGTEIIPIEIKYNCDTKSTNVGKVLRKVRLDRSPINDLNIY